jgi:hypothetical protein
VFGACLLVVLFTVLKVAQSQFCAHLMAFRLGEKPPQLTLARFWKIASAQLRLQAWGIFAIPLAAAIAVPFGWVYSYYQNATVLAVSEKEDQPLGREAWSLAELWPAQNHVGLLLIKLFGLTAWINLMMAIYGLPWLANRLLGIDNIFAIRGIALLNTTFLALVTVLAWLVTDPLVKAFYTLRIFHGRARRTGDDLRTELATTRTPLAAAVRPALIALVLLVSFANPHSARAGETTSLPVESSEEKTVRLDTAIDRALAQSQFQWALRPLPPEPGTRNRNAFERFVDDGLKFFEEIIRSIGRMIGKALDWIDRLLKPKRNLSINSPESDGTGAMRAVKILLYVLCGLVVAGLVWVVVRFWRQTGRREATQSLQASAVAAVPDLRDESVQATQLPCDGWIDLARQQIAAGEWRLALRALYLATLARRADEGLIVLARFKTNLDYEREIVRRALGRSEVVMHFRSRRQGFEDVWYGPTPASETAVRSWLAEFEQPSPPPL